MNLRCAEKGYEVYIGKNETKEIDFVAIRRDERVYVQVCSSLPEESHRASRQSPMLLTREKRYAR